MILEGATLQMNPSELAYLIGKVEAEIHTVNAQITDAINNHNSADFHATYGRRTHLFTLKDKLSIAYNRALIAGAYEGGE